uniref:Uncharacterized protein n=1 Tax=Setaria italica TaxID=4555 RepID=K3YNZ6_SETIT
MIGRSAGKIKVSILDTCDFLLPGTTYNFISNALDSAGGGIGSMIRLESIPVYVGAESGIQICW